MITKFTKAGLSATLRHAGLKSVSLASPTHGFLVHPNLTITFQFLHPSPVKEKRTLKGMAYHLRGHGAAVRIDGNTLHVSNPMDRKAKPPKSPVARRWPRFIHV